MFFAHFYKLADGLIKKEKHLLRTPLQFMQIC